MSHRFIYRQTAAVHNKFLQISGNFPRVLNFQKIYNPRHNHELCYNSWTNQDAIWDVDSIGTGEPCVLGGDLEVAVLRVISQAIAKSW